MSAAYIQMDSRLILSLKQNTMNPDQTAPKRAVWSGPILFEILVIKAHEQQREQMTIAINSGKMVRVSEWVWL